VNHVSFDGLPQLDEGQTATVLASAARRAKQAHNATPTHNLPRQLTSVVGRATELADLARLQASTPWLTLVDCHVVEVGAACAFADNGGTSQADC